MPGFRSPCRFIFVGSEVNDSFVITSGPSLPQTQHCSRSGSQPSGFLLYWSFYIAKPEIICPLIVSFAAFLSRWFRLNTALVLTFFMRCQNMAQHSAPNWTPWPLSCVSDVWRRKSWDLPCTVLLVGSHRETAAICNSSTNLSTSRLTATGVYPWKKMRFEHFFSTFIWSVVLSNRNVNRLHLNTDGI